MGFPKRTWASRGMRLAFLVALIFAGHDAVTRYLTWSDLDARNLESLMGYRCAARLSDQVLLANQNEFGIANVRQFECATKDFFVSIPEIKEVRAGTMDFSSNFHVFDAASTFSAGLVGFAMTALICAAAFLGVGILRWIWGSSAAG